MNNKLVVCLFIIYYYYFYYYVLLLYKSDIHFYKMSALTQTIIDLQ